MLFMSHQRRLFFRVITVLACGLMLSGPLQMQYILGQVHLRRALYTWHMH